MPNPRRILLINGHPDAGGGHLAARLAEAYERGAMAAGHAVERLDVGALQFPVLRSRADYLTSDLPPDIRKAQAAVKAADHLVLLFPIWFGGPPAYLKAFFEQLLREGPSLSRPQAALYSLLTGRSARVIVTMGAPTPLYRLALGGHGVSSLTRGLLWMSGVSPLRETLLGGAHAAPRSKVDAWSRKVEALGARAI